MESHTVKLFWFQIPATFPGVPDELRVLAQKLGDGFVAKRKYRTRLRVRLEAHLWHMQKNCMRYCFAPPLLFSVFHDDFLLKITVKDLRTKASRTYRIEKECLGAASQLSDIHLSILPKESTENMSKSEEGPASPSEAYFSASEELDVSQDWSFSLKDPVRHPVDPSCGIDDSVVQESPVLSDEDIHSQHVKILTSPSSSKKGLRRRTFGTETSQAPPFPTTQQFLDLIQTTQQNVTFPDFTLDSQDRNQDVLQSVFQYKCDKQQMLAKKTYNSNIYYFRLKRRIMEMFISFYFHWLSLTSALPRELSRYYEGLKRLRVLQIYTRTAEKAAYGHELVRTQVRLEQRILKLINLLRFKLKHVKRLRGDINLKLAKGRGALFRFTLRHLGKTVFWLLVTTALGGLYLFMSYNVTGEVKYEVLVFVTILIVVFSLCAGFDLGRVYIVIATLQIVVKFTSRTHLIFILTEMIRLQLIVVENMRRVGKATTCFRDLYKNIVKDLIEREREKRAEMLTLILDFISTTRERMAQALRAVFQHAQFIYRMFQALKGNYKTIGLMELICKVVVPTLQNYCGASVSEVRKDCETKVGFLKYLGVCYLVEVLRTTVCALFFHPFNFMCNFDEVVIKFLNEALEEIGLREMYQELREQFMMDVDIEYRFNHTIYTGGKSDEKDKSEIFDHIAKYFPTSSSSEILFLLLYYLIMVMAFLKPLFDLWSFKRNLSFCNDCVDSSTFKKLDKKLPKAEQLLPLKKADKEHFRQHIYSLPGSTSKKYLLLVSVYWPSAAAIVLSMIATFFSALIRIDLSFVSFLDLTTLSSDSKEQMKEARRAAKSYTVPGIFTKSAEDFYKKMNKFKEEDVERAIHFKDYGKKHKSCAPVQLKADPRLLHKLYTWSGIIFFCNTIGLIVRLTYGKLLEHFFPNYKVPRAMDLRDRIEQQRVLMAERRRKLEENLRKLEAEEEKDAAKKKKKEEELKKKREEEKKKKKEEEEKKEKEKKEEEEKKEKEKKEEDIKEKEAGEEKVEEKPKTEPAKPVDDEPGKGLDPGSVGAGGGGAAVLADKVSSSMKKNFLEKFLSFIKKLVPNFHPFFMEKFVCTMCKKETTYKNLQECVQPTCGAVLCNACAHKRQEKYHGKCPGCGSPFILDTYLDFPLQPSPTRSLCEEDLEPWYIDPEVRFKWMKPLKLCTECGRHFVLNYLQERCVLCRKGGIRDFDPKKYQGPTRKPGDPFMQIHAPGFDFIVAEKSSKEE